MVVRLPEFVDRHLLLAEHDRQLADEIEQLTALVGQVLILILEEFHPLVQVDLRLMRLGDGGVHLLELGDLPSPELLE